MRAVPSVLLAVVLTASTAGAQSVALETYLEQVRSLAEPDLGRCGVDVGLVAPAPAVELGLRWSGGKIQVDVRGLEAVPRARRAALVRCLRAVILRVAGSKAALAPRPLALETRPAPDGPAPPFDPTDAHSCRSDGDCTIICDDPADCCAGACGCSHAVNQAHVARVKAAAQAACKAGRRHCPAVACAHREFSAVCEQNRCKAVPGLFPR